MAHEVEAGPGDVRPRRGSYWRAAVVSGIAVLGAAVAAPVLYGATDQPARERPAPMMGAGHMMDPAQMAEMMKSGQHMMDPAQMAEMMKSGQHMMGPGPMMGGGR